MEEYYNEFDAHAAQWLRNLGDANAIPPGPVDERSIEDVRPDDVRGFRRAHFFAGIGVWSYAIHNSRLSDDLVIWSGSCPCQPFSAAGKRGGVDDERHLWPAQYHLIRECLPDVWLGEQVASKDGLAWLDLVHTDLEAAGYAVGAVDTCSAGVGAPHIRQRLRIAAVRMADTDQQQRDGRGDPRTRGRAQPSDGGGPVHALGTGLEGLVGYGDGGGQSGRVGTEPDGPVTATGAARGVGPTSGFWRNADWLYGRDGKWRPVEPGTFPLVDGAAFGVGSGSAYKGKSRAGMLKGYGNAVEYQSTLMFCNAVADMLKGETS